MPYKILQLELITNSSFSQIYSILTGAIKWRGRSSLSLFASARPLARYTRSRGGPRRNVLATDNKCIWLGRLDTMQSNWSHCLQLDTLFPFQYISNSIRRLHGQIVTFAFWPRPSFVHPPFRLFDFCCANPLPQYSFCLSPFPFHPRAYVWPILFHFSLRPTPLPPPSFCICSSNFQASSPSSHLSPIYSQPCP